MSYRSPGTAPGLMRRPFGPLVTGLAILALIAIAHVGFDAHIGVFAIPLMGATLCVGAGAVEAVHYLRHVRPGEREREERERRIAFIEATAPPVTKRPAIPCDHCRGSGRCELDGCPFCGSDLPDRPCRWCDATGSGWRRTDVR